MDLIMGWTAIFFLGVWRSNVEVGIFGVAFRTAMLTSVFLSAANTIVAPKFAELYRAGHMDALQITIRSAVRLVTLLSCPVLLVFLLASRQVMMIFGPGYINGAIVLIILTLGQFINAVTGPVGVLLMMTGHEVQLRNNIVFAAILNIALSIGLIPTWGAVGAAIATAASLAMLNVFSVYLVWTHLRISAFLFASNQVGD